MRALRRPPLPNQAQAWLDARQIEIDATSSPDTTNAWRAFRPAMNHNGVRDTLLAMAGQRHRCVFCGDSRGSEIEHYWPKSRFAERMFRWTNLLWACSPCNKRKGTRFPVDATGAPLLIDPTTDEPWRHLYFDGGTGRLTPRFDPRDHQVDAKGAATLAGDWLPINIEAVTEGRRICWRHLKRAAESFLAKPARDDVDEERLLEAFRESSHPEIVAWALHWEGASEPPFARLAKECPSTWEKLQGIVELEHR